MRKLIRKALRVYFLFSQTSFAGKTNKPSDIILWIPHRGVRYFFSDTAVYDYAIADALSRRGIKYNIKKGKDIGSLYGKTVFLSYSRNYLFEYSFMDYPANMSFLINQLEKQSNRVYPSSNEVALWENKTLMHKKFDDLNIPCPETTLYFSKQQLQKLDTSEPFLIKEEHSASSKGVHKIENKEALERLLDKEFFERNETVIVQKLLNMRRDLRVILVNDKIVHHYWRINHSKEWKPTSTGRGSSVDFESFPEKWSSFIIEKFKQLDIVTGAFDIAWENDDLENTPMILEVSPAYQLNPVTAVKEDLEQYGSYKKKLYFSKKSYDYQFIKQSFTVYRSIVAEVLLGAQRSDTT